MQKLVPLALVLAALGFLTAGCGGGSANVPDDAVAVVGDQQISKAEYDNLLDRAKQSFKASNRPFPKVGTQEYKALQNQALQYLIQQAEYEQEADDLGVKVSDKEIDDRINQIKKQYFNGSEAQYQANLKRQNLTNEEVRHEVGNQVLSEKLYAKVTSDVKVADSDIQKYYNSHMQDYTQPESRDVRHILVKSKGLADRLYSQLKGGASFAKLAKRYSQDPSSKDQGGKMVALKGRTVPPFDQTAFLLGKGTISKPIKTTYGWHIIQPLSDVKPQKVTPLKDVKEQIRQQLLSERKREAIAKWAEDVKKDFADKVHYQVGFAPPKTESATTTS
jgi:parvulin-like peptidyl-prolyl isomerase